MLALRASATRFYRRMHCELSEMVSQGRHRQGAQATWSVHVPMHDRGEIMNQQFDAKSLELEPNSRSDHLRKMYWSGEHRSYSKSQVLFGSEEPTLVGKANDFALMLGETSPVIQPHDMIAGVIPVRPAEGSRLNLGSYDGHYTPGHANLIRMGYTGIRDRAKEKLVDESDSAKRDFLEATVIAYEAACQFAAKHSEYAKAQAEQAPDPVRKSELMQIADACHELVVGPPQSFHAALQMVWFTFMYGGRGSIGRFDQWMYPLYTADLKSGRLTHDQAQELLENYFIKLNYFAGTNDSLRNIALAGQTADGKDASNAVSYMCLVAAARLMLPEPKLNLRLYRHSPHELIDLACRLTCKGLSNPAYFNDDVAVPSLLRLGIPIEDARDYCNDGCSELIIGGKGTIGFTNFDTLPMLNETVKKAVDEPFETFEDVVEDFERRLEKHIPKDAKAKREISFPYFAASIDDCLEEASTHGARYSIWGRIPSQMGNVADGLAVIRKLIFDEKSLTWAELNDALQSNYDGWEPLQQKILNRVPKYGNDDDYVDDIIKQIAEDFCDKLHETVQNEEGPGGKGAAGFMTFGIHGRRFIPTTPDGRRQGDNVASSFSPGLGRDMQGPTSVLKSVSKVDLTKASHGSVLDIAFHPSAVRGEEGHQKFVSFVETFLKLPCTTTLQVNVVDRETLMKARENPKDPQYRTLLVRVWGWSTVFVTLDPALQQHVIERTQHMM